LRSIETPAKRMNVFIVLLVFSAMASFMVIPWMSFVYRPYFAYYNGSDEQIYLTYQGALALLDDRSRGLSARLVLLFHELGWSGAALNLLMDVSAPLAIFGMVAFVLKILLSERDYLKAAWFVVFGSVLFNQSNPMLRSLLPDFRSSQTFWISAFEGFSPFIRSPEPQLSICMALLAVSAFARWRNAVLLLLPMPLLYDNVIMSYSYLVGVFLAKKYLSCRPAIFPEILVNAAVVMAMSAAVGAIDQFGAFSALADMQTHYRHTHVPAISIGLVIAAGVVCLQILRLRDASRPFTPWDSASVSVAFLQLFLTNHTVISGVSIFPQALQSVGGTFGSAFLAFAVLRIVRENNAAVEKVSFFILSFLIIFCINYSQGLKPASRYYRIQLFHDISSENLQEFRSNSLGYVGGSQLFKGYIGLAYAKQLIPPLAHFYNFPFFMSACKDMADINLTAADYVQKNISSVQRGGDRASVEQEIKAVRVSAGKVTSYRDRCPAKIPRDVVFKIYPVQNDTMLLIRLWPPSVAQQGIDF
jgi:hypothetical protein